MRFWQQRVEEGGQVVEEGWVTVQRDVRTSQAITVLANAPRASLHTHERGGAVLDVAGGITDGELVLPAWDGEVAILGEIID